MYASSTFLVQLSAKLLLNLILAMNLPKKLLNEEELFSEFEEAKFRNALTRVWLTTDWISLLGRRVVSLIVRIYGIIPGVKSKIIYSILIFQIFKVPRIVKLIVLLVLCSCSRLRQTLLKWAYLLQ